MNSEDCPCEASLQSKFSPGIVLDQEHIVYALVAPLTSHGGSLADLSKSRLKSKQLSVCRANHCDPDEAKSQIVEQQLIKDPTRKYEGASWALCVSIREIKLGTSERRAFCVHDDGYESFPAHAVVGFTEPSDLKLRNHREAARGKLKKLFESGKVPGLDLCPGWGIANG